MLLLFSCNEQLQLAQPICIIMTLMFVTNFDYLYIKNKCLCSFEANIDMVTINIATINYFHFRLKVKKIICRHRPPLDVTLLHSTLETIQTQEVAGSAQPAFFIAN